MNVKNLLQQAASRLDQQGIETARLDARLLLQKATGLSQEEILTAPETALAAPAQDMFEVYLTRRLQGEPVSRILGRRDFWGLDFMIGANVFDPRPESEMVVETALRIIKKPTAQILDLGAGSGCLLLSVLHGSAEMRGVGIDISPEAVRCARYNARRLALSARAHFLVGDWAVDYRGAFDLVMSNPPYIPQAALADLSAEVSGHDPAAALNGGADGLAAYRRIAALAPDLLAPGGQLIVEIAAGAADKVSEIFALAGLAKHDIIDDLSGHQRVVVASME